jgi:thiamine biosynthesis protein ThiS
MSENKNRIVLNGKTHELSLPCSVEGLLRQLGWKRTQVVVERNGMVVPRSEVGCVMLESEDKVEIILPVAGG